MALLLPKSLIVTVPKCGTIFTRSAVSAAGIRWQDNGINCTAIRHCGIRDISPDQREGRFSISFARDPLSYLKSLWCYGMDRGTASLYEEHRKLGTDLPVGTSKSKFHLDCMSSSWDEYCELVAKKHATQPSVAMYRRWGYIREPETHKWIPSEITVRFIGRLQNIAKDLVDALTQAGERFEADKILRYPISNASSARNKFKDYWFPKSIEQHILDKNKQLVDFIEGANDFDLPILFHSAILSVICSGG